MTRDPAPDIFPVLAASDDGAIHLAWQAWRDGRARILHRRFDGERWSDPIALSAPDANAWDPAIAARPDGEIAVAWDTYERGDYDIRVRRIRPRALGPIISVTSSPLFEAHTSVAFDAAGALWIAWDESGPDWGKDTWHLAWARGDREGTRLYQGRRIRVARFEPGGRLLAPARPIDEVLPQAGVEVCELPHLAADGRGRLWCFFRHREGVEREDGWAHAGVWDIEATAFDGARWSSPIPVPRSTGLNDVRLASARDASAPDGDGSLWIAWATDGRSRTSVDPKDWRAGLARIEVDGPAARPAAGAPVRPVPAAPPSIHPREAEDIARIRSYAVDLGGRTYRIYRGDLHRHTEHSPDGAGMEFILVADHNDGDDHEYQWWRREQSNDLFHIPGPAPGRGFVPLFGYERSVPYPTHPPRGRGRTGVRPTPTSSRSSRSSRASRRATSTRAQRSRSTRRRCPSTVRSDPPASSGRRSGRGSASAFRHRAITSRPTRATPASMRPPSRARP
ncbi:MAG: hypothetical protein JXP34_00050 [Planctomycetes bacterium]|nr:hypothetical protein [Planctomycetota bacterium]